MLFITLTLSVLFTIGFRSIWDNVLFWSGVWDIALYVILMYVYAIIFSDISQVDMDMMQYMVDNECSDAVLMHSIVEYTK